jgi:hypothetical protein
MPPDLPPLRWRAFRQPKRGQADDDYEDAFAGDPASGRFAVADGASEASFAAAWAQVLVEGFITAPGMPWKGLAWLPPLRQRWAEQVDHLKLPWYAETKRAEGAFATFLGLSLRPPRGQRPGTWQALAVGDSCLFHARGGTFLTSFPLAESAQFGSYPPLIRSRPPPPRRKEPEYEQAHGRWRPGDRFLLMTDALSMWFLEQQEHEHGPLAVIERLLVEGDAEKAFAAWVEERRDNDNLRNDDVTLVVIDLEAESQGLPNNGD